jgi:MFS family permease
MTTQQPAYPIAKSWYVVAVLTLIYVFSFIDRQILNLLVAPIRRDLGIGDTAMGLLIGFSFALFYTFFGMPLGWLADRVSRRGVIAVGLASWSLFTAGCGLARNFAQMALLRMGVGVGEAALSPAAYSLIVDYFPARLLGTATAVYSMGICIGSGLAFVFGGLVVRYATQNAAQQSWREVFYWVGLPGLAAVLLLLTFEEPPRKGRSAHQPDAREAWRYLRAHPLAILGPHIGFGLHYLTTYAATSWLPSYFFRVHAMSPGEFGIRYGLIVAIAGSLGMLTGGWLSDRWAARGHDAATMQVAWWSIAFCVPFALGAYLAPDPSLALALTAPMAFFGLLSPGLAPAAMNQIMPPHLRGQGIALYLFIVNLIGLGLGPVLPGALTEHYFRDDKLVHHSLAIVTAAAAIASLIALRVSLPAWRSLRASLK